MLRTVHMKSIILKLFTQSSSGTVMKISFEILNC